jgi:mitochondrial fission protein ELM1
MGPPNTVTFSSSHDPHRGLILLGGVDSKSHKWDSRSVVEKISNIIRQEAKMAWTISSSPRTPDDACRLLDDLAKEMEKVSFFRSTQTPDGWVEEQYALNSKVWVTGDSMSMIYEALTAGCSVGILPVKWKKQQNKFQKSIDGLIDKEMVVEYQKLQIGEQMGKLNREPLNEALRCAEEILRRWWPDRLP